jgi:hypothetical protein
MKKNFIAFYIISQKIFIVARMASRLDAMKIEREYFGFHKPVKQSQETP